MPAQTTAGPDEVPAWWDEHAADLREPAAAGRAFAAAVSSGLDRLPLPGAGRTARRWQVLAAVTEADVTLGRLFEAHADALAILAEIGAADPQPGQRWGVWAAEPPQARVQARPDGAGWRLDGTKAWCSGASLCTHALVTAHASDGRRLFAVDLSGAGVHPAAGGWRGTGMTGADTEDVRFDGAWAVAVGEPGAYLDRPGFWHGALGVAACWHGGAVGVAAPLYAAVPRRPDDPHAAAHLGAVDAALAASRAALEGAAAEVDADPDDGKGVARLRALQVRAVVESAAAEVLTRVGRALGPAPLAQDGAHARRVADLTLYLRQSHAERDLAEVGALAAERGTPSWRDHR